MGSDIIRATATFQEANEPPRQRPIIQISQSNGQQQVLPPGLVRASIDSGRDNPFRPDGEIYKLADPIVDYYKHGPNQSRGQSPTDSQLLLSKEDSKSDKKNKKDKKVKKADKKKKKNSNGDEGTPKGSASERKSCWRRWFCCCCSKCCNKKESCEDDRGADVSQYSPVPALDNKTKEFKQTKIVALSGNESNTKPLDNQDPSATLNNTSVVVQQVPDLPPEEESRLAQLAKDLSEEQLATKKNTKTKSTKAGDESTQPKTTGNKRCTIS